MSDGTPAWLRELPVDNQRAISAEVAEHVTDEAMFLQQTGAAPAAYDTDTLRAKWFALVHAREQRRAERGE